jgi:hypothetical protein
METDLILSEYINPQSILMGDFNRSKENLLKVWTKILKKLGSEAILNHNTTRKVNQIDPKSSNTKNHKFEPINKDPI